MLAPTLRRTAERDFDIAVTMGKRFDPAASAGDAEPAPDAHVKVLVFTAARVVVMRVRHWCRWHPLRRRLKGNGRDW